MGSQKYHNMYLHNGSLLTNKADVLNKMGGADTKECKNYRGISILNTSYKVLSSILCEKLKPYVINTIGRYQCGFMPGRSTTDQIFTLRQILEKTQEYRTTTHHLFIDFKQAYDMTALTGQNSY